MNSSDLKQRLIAGVKKEVKQLMEEAVTKKYVHEDSSSITKLCASIEACLSQGLKRRALGLFKTSSTTALLHKVAKTCPEAQHISKMLNMIESSDMNKTSSSSDSFNKSNIIKRGNSHSVTSMNQCTNITGLVSMKYLWIRLAIFEKKLVKIIEYLVLNANTYYDRDALVADVDYGSILSSLLVGPCALEFTRTKTANHYWTDPHADELVQRHRISTGRRASSTSRPPIVNFKRTFNASADEANSNNFKSMACSTIPKDYVESLHQNSKVILLYGKNNVHVLPKSEKFEKIAGYLSLHQSFNNLFVKWTPNQLMNSYSDDDENEEVDKDVYWEYALNINIDDIVYVHCHQRRSDDSGGTIILVGHDGVQRPPIQFPEGGHMQQFLSCLETGLLPHGQLDPPLWAEHGIGKLFPKTMRRRILPSVMETLDESPVDYVFRIVSKSRHEEFAKTNLILDFVRNTPRRKQLSSCSTTGSSDCSSKSVSIDHYPSEHISGQIVENASIEKVCSTMRQQIISRAFYGWLAYCRHLSTVRTHLSGLVNDRITPKLKTDDTGLTKERWSHLNCDGVLSNATEFYRLVYFGGVHHDLRKEVWPYLLGYYNFGSTAEERNKQNDMCKHYYETTMSEWLAVEAIVQQRDKEKIARAVAKLSSSSTSGNDKTKTQALTPENGDLENDVFEDISDIYAGDVQFCNEAQQHENIEYSKYVQEIPCNDLNIKTNLVYEKTHLLVSPMPRPTKTSTDSGHVDSEFDDIEKLSEGLFMTTDVGRRSCSSSSSVSYKSIAKVPIQNVENQTKLNDNLNINELQIFDHENEKMDTNIVNNDEKPPTIECATIDFPCTHHTFPTNEEFIEELNIPHARKPSCISPASSIGGIYSSELLEQFGLNLHRIEKDVQRCDRNYWYFANDNLDKLRNIISTYVWEHLEIGYMQGMCDLVAPLLVIFDDESLTYHCFSNLMKHMIDNFPSGDAMDMHFANMRSLIQILDSEMYDMMDANGDYTHFYFCYRWFLLDFKREFIYDDVFATWEVIWAAKHIASGHFVLFMALALLETYRDVILSNSMDFTDVIKFFNEMAERHNVRSVLQLARSLVLQLQIILENKESTNTKI